MSSLGCAYSNLVGNSSCHVSYGEANDKEIAHRNEFLEVSLSEFTLFQFSGRDGRISWGALATLERASRHCDLKIFYFVLQV